MRDIDLFAKLLELESPWIVSDIAPDFEKKEITITVIIPEKTKAACRFCGCELPIYDHRTQRVWRHLDTMQFKTYISAEVPRVNCSEHGVHTIKTPWAEDRSRFTILFERLAIDVLTNSATQQHAAELLGISWDEIHHIQERAVQRGLQRRDLSNLTAIGIDEKAFGAGQNYASVLYDIKNGAVIDVVKGRTEVDATNLLNKLPEEAKNNIEVIAMDMWQAFENAAETVIPKADIVHDKYHIASYLNKAVDEVRREEMRSLKGEEDNPLKCSRYTLLKNPKNWDREERKKFKEVQNAEMKTGRAWSIKETFKHFWDYKYRMAAENFFNDWFWWATHSRLEPIAKVAHMIKDRFDNILTYLVHRVTNAVAEGINSKIQVVKASARGFRNFENYRIAILFHCGKLDMSPGTTR